MSPRSRTIKGGAVLTLLVSSGLLLWSVQTVWGMESRVSKLEENARRDVEWRTEVREELRDIKKLLMEGRK